MLSWLARVSPPPMLGRWCHPASNRMCNWEIKADLANADNSCAAKPPDIVLEDEETRIKLYLLGSFYPLP